MQHECRITVLETKVFPEYQEKYLADPKSGPCPCFQKGDTFLLKRTAERDDEREILRGGVGRHQPVCLHSPPGRIHHAQVDQ